MPEVAPAESTAESAAESTVQSAVVRALDGGRLPALVVSAEYLALDGLEAVRIAPGEAKPEGRFRTVLLAVRDVDDLRRTVARLPGLGWARVVAVVVADTDRVLTLRPDPSWPALSAVEAGLGHTRLEFSDRLEVRPVLAALARGAVAPAPGRWDAHGGLRVASPGQAHDDPATTVPPDVVVDPPTPPVVSEATGRAPRVLGVAELDDLVGLDDAVYRPVGFRRDWTRGVVDLDPATRLGPSLVRDLRDAQGVRLAPGASDRLVAGLAMSGVPLLVGDAPAWLRAATSPGDPDEVSPDGALDDPLRREELSVRQRRAALTHHSVLAARSDLAASARVRAATHPSVSVLLPTRRPDQLDHALAQVARQRRTLPGAEVELVLAAHGFTPDPDLVAAASEMGGLATTIVTATTDSSWGDVLRAATDAASGDLVLTMDDDGFHGPDVVTDLLLARRYSGAEVVGMPVELVYLEHDHVTVRRAAVSESHAADVLGGPVLVDRTLLRELGGWRPAPSSPTAHLLDQVRRAGGSVYGTHGLGHLQRAATDPGDVVTRWSGFRPSALMELG